jgi:hypothetical protein
MVRISLVLLAALLFSSAARAQSAFDPVSVAYVLCVTDETKKLALVAPPIAKEVIIERAFGACGDVEAQARKSFAEKGASAGVIDERITQMKKLIRLTAPDDVDRFRVNKVPR